MSDPGLVNLLQRYGLEKHTPLLQYVTPAEFRCMTMDDLTERGIKVFDLRPLLEVMLIDRGQERLLTILREAKISVEELSLLNEVHITLESFAMMTHEDLKELGVRSHTQRKKLGEACHKAADAILTNTPITIGTEELQEVDVHKVVKGLGARTEQERIATARLLLCIAEEHPGKIVFYAGKVLEALRGRAPGNAVVDVVKAIRTVAAHDCAVGNNHYDLLLDIVRSLHAGNAIEKLAGAYLLTILEASFAERKTADISRAVSVALSFLQDTKVAEFEFLPASNLIETVVASYPDALKPHRRTLSLHTQQFVGLRSQLDRWSEEEAQTTQPSSQTPPATRNDAEATKTTKTTETTETTKTTETTEWVPDSEAQTCHACTRKFTLLHRRHHCRNCGGVFCRSCASHFIALSKLGFTKPVRVCIACFEALGIPEDSGI